MVEDLLGNFLIAVVASEVGLMLFILGRKPKFTKFVWSMSLLVIIVPPIAPVFPLLAEYRGGVYFFLPIYLFVVNLWLFITKNWIIGNMEWKEETDVKKAIRKTWLLLITGFFVFSIIIVTLAPHIPKWS